MERLFYTHEIRKSRACAPLWTLTTLDAGGLEGPEKVAVPSVWESHPALRKYRGRGVYEQEIVCGGNVRLFFGGVSFKARVYLDDLLLAEHYGAYAGFGALALGLSRGRHRLRVEADNRFGEDSALHIPNDYYACDAFSGKGWLEGTGGDHRPESDGAAIERRFIADDRRAAAGYGNMPAGGGSPNP